VIICGTGHRPDKLGGYTTQASVRLFLLARNWLLLNRPERVISGGALGWDQALASAARSLGIPYVLALPFPGFEDRWPKESKDFLYGLMVQASAVKYICDPGYAGWKMQKRNEWMVDHSDKVLALWNGVPGGGTSNCISYANKVGKPITNLWDTYVELYHNELP
jgi:uncharacterized phage-like protein YoqJ